MLNYAVFGGLRASQGFLTHLIKLIKKNLDSYETPA